MSKGINEQSMQSAAGQTVSMRGAATAEVLCSIMDALGIAGPGTRVKPTTRRAAIEWISNEKSAAGGFTQMALVAGIDPSTARLIVKLANPSE